MAKYIRSFPQTKEFIRRISELLIYLIPHYIREGKSYLTIAFGCTGGKHRSVMIAEDVKKRLAKAGYNVKVSASRLAGGDLGRLSVRLCYAIFFAAGAPATASSSAQRSQNKASKTHSVEAATTLARWPARIIDTIRQLRQNLAHLDAGSHRRYPTEQHRPARGATTYAILRACCGSRN